MIKRPEVPCPGCGAFAREFKEGQSVCAYCGATLAPLPFTHAGGRCPLESPLSLGLRCRIEGKEYVAVGRIAYEVVEEGVSYPWEEWVLLSQDGEARYLEFDEGKWSLNTVWLEGPSLDSVFAQIDNEVAIPGGIARCTEHGVGTLIGAQGEIPWEIRIGERVPFAEYRGGDTRLSVEWNSAGEAEWYRSRPLDSVEVLKMFGLHKVAEEQQAIQDTKTDQSRFGCLSVVLAVFAFCGFAWASNVPGRTVAVQSAVTNQIPETGLVLPQLYLSPGGRVHRLELSTSGLTSSSVWVQAVLEDKAGAVYDHDAEFWDESGYDEGAWHEWVTASRAEFKVKQAGFHQVRLKADPELAGAALPVTVRIAAAAMYPAPLAWFGSFAMLVAVVSFVFSAMKRTAWSGTARK